MAMHPKGKGSERADISSKMKRPPKRKIANMVPAEEEVGEKGMEEVSCRTKKKKKRNKPL